VRQENAQARGKAPDEQTNGSPPVAHDYHDIPGRRLSRSGGAAGCSRGGRIRPTSGVGGGKSGGCLTVNFLAPEEGTRTIVEFAEQYPIRAVLAADDDGVILAAAASAALGVSHNPVHAVSAARDKYRTRAILAEAGMPSPRFQRVSIDADPGEVASRVTFPCVIKPLSLSASRGVIRADDPTQFAWAFGWVAGILQRPEVSAQTGAHARQVLVESFIPGIEVALEGLLTQGQLRVLALFDKPDPLDGPFFEETIYVTPSRLPAPAQKEIAAHPAAAVKALGLRNGPVHAELRVNDQGPWVLEMSRHARSAASAPARCALATGSPWRS
jgi:biotin carboxylase